MEDDDGVRPGGENLRGEKILDYRD